VNVPGPVLVTGNEIPAESVPPTEITRFAGPGVTSKGTWALIWVGLTYSSGAGLPFIVNEEPLIVTGRGNVSACPVPEARLAPYIVISEPGAIEADEFAEFTTPALVEMGAAGEIEKATGFDNPPGLTTLTATEPGLAMRVAGTVADN